MKKYFIKCTDLNVDGTINTKFVGIKTDADGEHVCIAYEPFLFTHEGIAEIVAESFRKLGWHCEVHAVSMDPIEAACVISKNL